MTHIEATSLIKQSCESAEPNGLFVNARRKGASFDSIDGPFPLSVLLPFRETQNYETGLTTRQVVMLFLAKDDVNNSDEERDVLVNEMSELKDHFVEQVNNNLSSINSLFRGKAEPIKEVIATPEYMVLGGRGSGYSIQFTLKSIKRC